MNAAEIARQLGGHRYGRWWRCRCPVHQGKQESLAIRDGERALIVVCHAGCLRSAVLDEFRRLGLLNGSYTAPAAVDEAADTEKLREIARRIWDAARPAERAPELACYLRSRTITMPVPPALRFARTCFHKATGQTFPAMISRVSDAQGGFLAIQRTYLTDDFLNKAPVEPPKMSLGGTVGGAIRLAAAGPVLMIGEGVETVLSVMQVKGLPGWAVTGNSNYRSLVLPDIVEEVIFLGDNDTKRKARDAVLRSIGIARQRFLDEGRRVRIVFPPRRGEDFNDILIRETRRGIAA